MSTRMIISLVCTLATAWPSGESYELQATEQPQVLTIKSEGMEFSVQQRSSAPIPGFNESVEVFLEDITGGQVGLGIRTLEGKELVPEQSVGEGSEVAFRIGEDNYTIRVTRLVCRLLGDDYAELVVERGGAGGGRELHEDGPAPETSAPEPAETIRSKLVELIEEEMAGVDEVITRALQRLDAGQLAEARDTFQEAKQINDELRRGLRWTQLFATRSVKEAHYLSLVKVQIVRARPHVEHISENGSPDTRARGRLLGRFMSSRQDIDARVLEAHILGRAYRERSVRGRLNPSQVRSDLLPGQSVDLFAKRSESGGVIDRSREGQDYWLVITPPEATEAVPWISGGGGPSRILLAIPARKL